MKKIMFNERYRLNQAVLEGLKTNTRRIIPARIINYADTTCFLTFDKKPLSDEQKDYKCYETCDGDYVDIRDFAAYRVGEEVAVAQSYKEAGIDAKSYHVQKVKALGTYHPAHVRFDCTAGWNNKMFVRADLMPHRIRITNVRVERLQDISDEDCLKEGIEFARGGYYTNYNKETNSRTWLGNTPKEAFSALIDKTCGKGTWNSNPWVFVYDFELIK